MKTKGKFRRIAVTTILTLFLATGCLAGFVYYKAGPGALILLRMNSVHKEEKKEFTTQEVVLDGTRPLRIRIYRPITAHAKVIIAIHGVHYDGYDEGRLVEFARQLVAADYAVVTPEISDLKNYRIIASAVDDIERTVLWTLDESGLIGEEKVGIIGFSFAGGLSISAASRSSLKGRISAVLSFGGHGDLQRTMEYLVTGQLPGGGNLEPHMYAVAVLLFKFADRCVPADQVEALRHCVLQYLHEKQEQAKASKAKLPPQSRKFVDLCLHWKPRELGKILEPHVRNYVVDPVLSPVKGAPPQCPLFFLHGKVDSVIPPSESVRLGEWATPKTRAQVLLSELIVHVELGEKEQSWQAMWELSVFITQFLRS